ADRDPGGAGLACGGRSRAVIRGGVQRAIVLGLSVSAAALRSPRALSSTARSVRRCCDPGLRLDMAGPSPGNHRDAACCHARRRDRLVVGSSSLPSPEPPVRGSFSLAYILLCRPFLAPTL